MAKDGLGKWLIKPQRFVYLKAVSARGRLTICPINHPYFCI